MTYKAISFLSIGLILIFGSLLIFTQPALVDAFDFSDKGQIGDTIGGISAPVINLIGALLVYFSFLSQIKANKIQIKALEDEKEVNLTQKLFDNHISLLEDIKKNLRELEFIVFIQGRSNPDGSSASNTHIVYKGLNALNEYLVRMTIIKDSSIPRQFTSETFNRDGILLNFTYLLLSVSDLINQINKNIKDKHDKEFLMDNIKLFYNGFLKKNALEIIERQKVDDDKLVSLKYYVDKIESALHES
jgi:hypothetical protein